MLCGLGSNTAEPRGQARLGSVSFDPLSDLFDQMQPGFRRPFLFVWNGLAIGGVVLGVLGRSFQAPAVLLCFSLAGFLVAVVAFGLLASPAVRHAVLSPGYSLEGCRLLLGVASLAGALIGAGAGMMLLGS